MMKFLLRAAAEAVVPLAAIGLLAALVFVIVLDTSTEESGGSADSGSSFTWPTETPWNPRGDPVIFNRIESSLGTTYFPAVAIQEGVYDATNPVTVAMAIGGLRYQPASEPATWNYGHLHILIDQPVPGPLEIIDENEVIDLADASHVTTLPHLSPGEHTLHAVFANSNNRTGPFVAYATVVINIVGDS